MTIMLLFPDFGQFFPKPASSDKDHIAVVRKSLPCLLYTNTFVVINSGSVAETVCEENE